MKALPPIRPPFTPSALASSTPELKNGRTWYRRLRKATLESLPYFLQAVRAVMTRWPMLGRAAPPTSPTCARCGRPWGHSDHDVFGSCAGPEDGRTWLEELVIEELAKTPAMVWRELAQDEGLVADERLLGLMEAEGLDVAMAAARLGLDPRMMERRVKADPILAMRVENAWLRTTANLVRVAHQKARAGESRELLRVLGARDPRYRETIAVEIGEKEIRKSAAWKELLGRIVGALGPGHTCDKCGGCQCRERVEGL